MRGVPPWLCCMRKLETRIIYNETKHGQHNKQEGKKQMESKSISRLQPRDSFFEMQEALWSYVVAGRRRVAGPRREARRVRLVVQRRRRGSGGPARKPRRTGRSARLFALQTQKAKRAVARGYIRQIAHLKCFRLRGKKKKARDAYVVRLVGLELALRLFALGAHVAELPLQPRVAPLEVLDLVLEVRTPLLHFAAHLALLHAPRFGLVVLRLVARNFKVNLREVRGEHFAAPVQRPQQLVPNGLKLGIPVRILVEGVDEGARSNANQELLKGPLFFSIEVFVAIRHTH